MKIEERRARNKQKYFFGETSFTFYRVAKPQRHLTFKEYENYESSKCTFRTKRRYWPGMWQDYLRWISKQLYYLFTERLR